MNNKNYFENVGTMEDLKNEYRKLAKKYHPDISKVKNATKTMQLINKQYEQLFEQLKHTSKYTKNENVNTFKNIINEVIKYENVIIDVVGSWIWIYGNGTYNKRKQLGKKGFKWSKNRKKWYWFDGIEKSRKRVRGKGKSYKHITQVYGLQRIKTEKKKDSKITELKPLLT